MAEIAWVLERAYRLAHAEIAATIERLLQADVLVVEREQEVFAALVAMRAGLGSFIDTLISAINLQAGCAHTVTFDRRARRLPGFATL